MADEYLVHHGILGMRWGIRRYRPYPKGHSGGKEVGEAARLASAHETHVKEEKPDRKDTPLYDYGVKLRTKRQRKNVRKAEDTLGRRIGDNDFYNLKKITRKGLKEVKRYDDQEREYNEVKKDTDPSYEWLRGYSPEHGVALGRHAVNSIIREVRKHPNRDVYDIYERKANGKRILKILGDTAKLTAPITIAALAVKHRAIFK